MHTLDILYISLAICAFLLIGIIGYLVYHIVQALHSIKIIIDDVADIAEDVKGTKNFLKKDVLGRLFGLGRDLLQNRYDNKRRKITTRSSRN